MKKNAAISILAIIIIAGGVLRFHNLFTQSIWLDEAAQLFIANQPSLDQLIRWMHIDQQPPMSHLLWHFWMKAFNTPEHARILSAIMGVATLPIFFLLAKELFSVQSALFSTLLLSLSAKHIWASQEARPYVFFVFFVCLSYYAFVLWLKKPEREKLIWYVASTVPALYTHYYAIFFIAPQTLFAIINFRKKIQLIKEIIGAQVVAGILFVPWLPYFERTFTKISTYNFWLGVPAPSQLHSIITKWAGGIIGILLIGYLTLRYIREGDNKKHLVVAWLFFSTAAPFILSYYRPFFHERYITPALLPLYLLAGGGFSYLARIQKTLIVIAAILLSITPLQAHYAYTKDQWRDAAEYVEARFNQGEKIIYDRGYASYPFKTYFTIEAEHIPIVDIKKTIEEVPKIVENQTTIWLISSHAQDDGTLSKTLHKYLPVESEKKFRGMTIKSFSMATAKQQKTSQAEQQKTKSAS
ncbi:MAG: glycosyltransferase family 39 protein [Candidatus Woesearchaeota archaeon]